MMIIKYNMSLQIYDKTGEKVGGCSVEMDCSKEEYFNSIKDRISCLYKTMDDIIDKDKNEEGEDNLKNKTMRVYKSIRVDTDTDKNLELINYFISPKASSKENAELSNDIMKAYRKYYNSCNIK